MSLRTKFMSGFAALALISGGVFIANSAAAPEATAQSAARATVDAAKSAGKIGETAAGYLEAVSGMTLSSAERGAMNEINIGRKSHYTKLAEAQGVSVEVVAALTGEKLIAKAPSGSKILAANGKWMTK
jgi:uncharacterized protein YdbL (DUF1318 family)